MDQEQTSAALDRIRSEIEAQENHADRHADAAEAEADPIKRKQHERRSAMHELFIGWLSAITINAGAAAGNANWMPGQLARLTDLFQPHADAADAATAEGQVEKELMETFRVTVADIAKGTDSPTPQQTDQ